ncbi:MAG: efflux RND transporter permease subunit, partial [Cytophagales bacterium]|nr:efflux RND transporter permease subunit [Cytophagales bacterium]
MVRFLIQRPIAVTVTLIAFAVLSLAASGLLPVSLMPAVDIPEIIVKLDAPEKNAREMEFNYLSGLRRRLQQVSHLDGLESYASNGQGVVRMRFQYGTNISYAFIEANELIDSYMHRMPKDFKRPRVIKTSATDVPVFYLNVSMKKKEDEPRFMELSEFTEQVIKKRLEQLPEVAMADISGTEYPEIVLEADPDFLKQMGISRQNLVNVLEESNYSMGNIRVRSGLYEFKVRYVSSRLVNRADIEKLTLKAGDRLFKLKELVKVRIRPQAGKGLVLSDGDRSVALAVIKKSSARMASLKKKTEEQLASMRKDYPRLKFRVEGSQTDLLDYSLGNLESSLWIGGTL